MKWNFFLIALLAIGGCHKSDKENVLILATTTSTQDSGLLDALIPGFENETGAEVKVVAVGSGQAIQLGERGDADVLLTHSPDAEARFMSDGHGEIRWFVMYNDYVVIGPSADAAGIAKQATVVKAFRKIAQNESLFVSRGDDSGTHKKELRIWIESKIAPQGDWYIQAGDGMANVLRIANEKRAYTLSDRGTFLAHQDSIDLKVLFDGDLQLRNPYSVMVVNPSHHAHVNRVEARRFANFLVSANTQAIIREFGKEKFGQPLFFPNANSTANE